MGCGCGGSTPLQVVVHGETVEARAGGPGEPGYTWNGPPAPPMAPRAATPEPAQTTGE